MTTIDKISLSIEDKKELEDIKRAFGYGDKQAKIKALKTITSKFGHDNYYIVKLLKYYSSEIALSISKSNLVEYTDEIDLEFSITLFDSGKLDKDIVDSIRLDISTTCTNDGNIILYRTDFSWSLNGGAALYLGVTEIEKIGDDYQFKSITKDDNSCHEEGRVLTNKNYSFFVEKLLFLHFYL